MILLEKKSVRLSFSINSKAKMLVKIRFNNQSSLINLQQITLEELKNKSKNILNISEPIHIEYSECQVDSNLFEEIIDNFGKQKQLISFDIYISNFKNGNRAPDENEYTLVEYLDSDINIGPSNNSQKAIITSDVLVRDADSIRNEEHEEANVLPTSENETNEPPRKQKRQTTVNTKISSIIFEEIFEIQKCLGSVSSGHPLDNSDRVSASKAIIRKVLAVAGLDYM